MELMLKKQGGTVVDFDGLTATAQDVEAGEKFYGGGSEDIQTGTLKKNAQIKKKLGANESYAVPTGIIPAGSYVYQDITKKNAMSIMPKSYGSTAGVKGCYMNGNVTILGIENLTPENVRAGITVGTVPGEFHGWVNNDPLTPYWRGIFAPGQSAVFCLNRYDTGGGYIERVDWKAGEEAPDGYHISVTTEEGGYAGFRFVTPLELEGVKSVSIMYALDDSLANNYSRLVLTEENYGSGAAALSSGSWAIREEFGEYETFVLPGTGGSATFKEKTFAISNASKYHFVTVGVGVRATSSRFSRIRVRYVKFNK